MLSPAENRNRNWVSGAKTILLLIFLCCLAAVLVRWSASLKGTDFPNFYCAARMVAEGHGKQLYDAELQRQFQERYAGGVGTLYIHPPFEAVLYFAVAWLPLRQAYLLWSVLSLICLGMGIKQIARCGLQGWDWRILLAASLLFVPVLLCFLQGQDSLILLLLVTICFTTLRRRRAFAGGCWLAPGLFKFQLVLPLALVLLLTCKRGTKGEFAKGFALVALVMAAFSTAVSGVSTLWIYPEFLLRLQTQAYTGIAPQAMANFRGLIWLIFRGQRTETIAGVSLVSLAALIYTLILCKRASSDLTGTLGETEFDHAFTSAIIFAVLVSYYLNPHDVTVALIPSFLLLRWSWDGAKHAWDVTTLFIGLVCIFVLPPIHLWALRSGRYCLVGVPLVALLVLGIPLMREAETPARRLFGKTGNDPGAR